MHKTAKIQAPPPPLSTPCQQTRCVCIATFQERDLSRNVIQAGRNGSSQAHAHSNGKPRHCRLGGQTTEAQPQPAVHCVQCKLGFEGFTLHCGLPVGKHTHAVHTQSVPTSCSTHAFQPTNTTWQQPSRMQTAEAVTSWQQMLLAAAPAGNAPILNPNPKKICLL
jgi:hypothetical protein